MELTVGFLVLVWLSNESLVIVVCFLAVGCGSMSSDVCWLSGVAVGVSCWFLIVGCRLSRVGFFVSTVSLAFSIVGAQLCPTGLTSPNQLQIIGGFPSIFTFNKSFCMVTDLSRGEVWIFPRVRALPRNEVPYTAGHLAHSHPRR